MPAKFKLMPIEVPTGSNIHNLFNIPESPIQKMLVAITDFGGVILDSNDEIILDEIENIGNDGRFLGNYHIDDEDLPEKTGFYIWEGFVRQTYPDQDGDYDTTWDGKFRPVTNEDLIEFKYNPIESKTLRISSKFNESIGDLI